MRAESLTDAGGDDYEARPVVLDEFAHCEKIF